MKSQRGANIMVDFLRGNLWEIKRSSTVKIFGGFLALAHFITYFVWMGGNNILSGWEKGDTYCHPLFENCEWLSSVSAHFFPFLTALYLILAGVTIFIFLFSSWVVLAWIFLGFVFFINSFFYIQDIRLSSNWHHLLIFLTFIYLFIPNKEKNLRLLLASIFIMMGLLKINAEWMSGLWFETQMGLPIKLGEWLAAVAILIETIVPLSLLMRDFRYFAIGFFSLLIYQTAVFYIDGFFAITMGLIFLVFFALHYWEQRKLETAYIYQSFIRPEPSRFWILLSLSLFWLPQTLSLIPISYPYFKPFEQALSLSPQVTSEECRQISFVTLGSNTFEISSPDLTKNWPDHLKCNPYIRMLEVRKACTQTENNTPAIVSSFLDRRSFKDKGFVRIFEFDNICEETHSRFNNLRFFSWNLNDNPH